MSDHCPTCGQAVTVVTSGEGTAHYEARADRTDELLARAQADRDRYRQALEEIAGDNESYEPIVARIQARAASELSRKRSASGESRKGRS